MKEIERQKAIKLRTEGFSIFEIAKKLGVAKSSVSIWVRDVHLNDYQLKTLRDNSHSLATIEKRRVSRLNNELTKRQIIVNLAENEIGSLTKRELWLIGVMLYWAEGGKTQRMVRFSNGDPRLIKIMMKFFREVCEVPEHKFRGYIHIHPHLNSIKAETYWSNVSLIPNDQFFKTYRKKNISSKGKRDSLPHGVMDVYVMDTELFLKILGWVNGIFKLTTDGVIDDIVLK